MEPQAMPAAKQSGVMERRRGADRRRPGGRLPAGQPERRRSDRRAAMARSAGTGVDAWLPGSASDLTGAARRAARYRAARALLATEALPALDWEDLLHWPAWGGLRAAIVDHLALAAGAVAYADEWHRCIDGQVLKRLREQLGPAAFDGLLTAPGAPDDLRRQLPPWRTSAWTGARDASWSQGLVTAGRDCLLAAVPPAALRDWLRQHHWPDSAAAEGFDPALADALAVVRIAIPLAALRQETAS